MAEYNFQKKKKGNLPSKEDAESIMENINKVQKENDENLARKKEQEEAMEKQQILAAAEQQRILLAQEQIRRKLRENFKKKEVEDKKKNVKKYLESSTDKNSKIKWKSLLGGHKLFGYVEDNLVFEISKSHVMFSLYIKDKKMLKEKKLNKYQGCSINISSLKEKSNKFI